VSRTLGGLALVVLWPWLVTPAAGVDPRPGEASAGGVSRPNVVLIIGDDHAWTDFGFMGSPEARTPAIDRLASEGLTFTRGYVTTALCSPSLATLLTGLHPHQHGITGNDPAPGLDRDAWLTRFLEHPMLPQLLADAGYRTLHTGKFWIREPAAVGFTDGMGATDRHGGRALAIGRDTMQPIDDFLDAAVAEDRPFFVWYAPFLPHTPHNPPQRLLDRHAAVADEDHRRYLAMIEWLDETCGHLLDGLEARGVADDTVVIYLSDNGWNAFGKSFPYENGVRTPLIVRWPRRVQPRLERERLAENIDVVPTILAAAGVPVPEGLPGVNLLDDEAVAARKTIFLANYAHDMADPDDPAASLWTRSCIHGWWKLLAWVEDPPEVKPSLGGWQHKDPAAMRELYDLEADPHETRNLAAERPELVRELEALLDAWWTPQRAVNPGPPGR
jgi:arylsulfatase A-like enzyme